MTENAGIPSHTHFQFAAHLGPLPATQPDATITLDLLATSLAEAHERAAMLCPDGHFRLLAVVDHVAGHCH